MVSEALFGGLETWIQLKILIREAMAMVPDPNKNVFRSKKNKNPGFRIDFLALEASSRLENNTLKKQGQKMGPQKRRKHRDVSKTVL